MNLPGVSDGLLRTWARLYRGFRWVAKGFGWVARGLWGDSVDCSGGSGVG